MHAMMSKEPQNCTEGRKQMWQPHSIAGLVNSADASRGEAVHGIYMMSFNFGSEALPPNTVVVITGRAAETTRGH